MSARAQGSTDSEARSLFRQGVQAASVHDYPAALEAFERSNTLHPAPTTQFNLAAALYELGQYREACQRLQSIAWADSAATAELRTRAQELMAKVEPKLSRLTVTVALAEQDLTLWLDGEPVQQAQLDGPLVLDAGPHLLTGRRQQQQVLERSLQLRPGEHVMLDLTVLVERSQAQVADTSPHAHPRTERAPVWRSWKLWTAVGAVLVASGVATGVALARTDEARTEPPVQGSIQPGVLTW